MLITAIKKTHFCSVLSILQEDKEKATVGPWEERSRNREK